ncbi:hypothetical protein LMH73_027810 [Vibrio splendidus]|nr:hypothetical protein [Vibrio splendidus]MCC4882761.1 hypothetical protein [Vibrio splendidus]
MSISFPITKKDSSISLLIAASNLVFLGALFGVVSLISVLVFDGSVLPYYARFTMIASLIIGITIMWSALLTESEPPVKENWTNFSDWRLSVKVGMFVIVNWLSTMIAWAHYLP